MGIDSSEKTEIISKQILAWTRREEAQRTQKVLIKATEENKDFSVMKKQKQENNTFDKTKQGEEKFL